MPGTEDVLLSGASYLTTAQLVYRVRHLLEDEPWQDTLSANYTAGAGSLYVSNPAKWAEGNLLEVDDGTATMMRVSATPTANPVVVQAGWNGTADVNHANGAIVLKNPRYPGYAVVDAINAACSTDINAASIYVVKQYSFTPSATVPLVAMPADFLGLVRGGVSQQDASTTITTVNYYRWLRIARNVPPTISASTVALDFSQSGFQTLTRPVYVFYRAPVSIATIPDDDIAELVVLLACKRVLGGVDTATSGRNLGTKKSVQGSGVLIRDAQWFDIQAQRMAQRVKATLRMQSPPERIYAR